MSNIGVLKDPIRTSLFDPSLAFGPDLPVSSFWGLYQAALSNLRLNVSERY